MRKKLAKKLKAKREAREVLPTLFSKAKEARKKGNKRMHRVWSNKIRYLRNKFKLKLDARLKRQICKHCYRVFVPTVNVRVRTRAGMLVYFCVDCKRYTKFVLK